MGPGQVVVGNTTSIAIHQAVAAALELRPGRRVIVSDVRNFPTDHYMVQGLAGALGGYEIRDFAEGRFDDAAVVLLSEVDYRTSERHDVAEVTARVQAAGALMIWDVCHSVGALQVDVSAADFAVGCTYKYLNAGPGAPAFLYVNPRHHADARNDLSGWHSHAEPFAFEADYRPAEGIRRFAVSTPHVLSFAALQAALDVWERVPLDLLRAKSVALGSLLVDLVGDALELASPADAERRGSHVSFRHPDGYPVMRALIDRGVHGDFRAPDILRFGLAPLYTRYVDVYDAAGTLRRCWTRSTGGTRGTPSAWRSPERVRWLAVSMRHTRRLAVTGARYPLTVPTRHLHCSPASPCGLRTSGFGGSARSALGDPRHAADLRGHHPRDDHDSRPRRGPDHA